ncbi:hypothetical protein OH77DRAFT_962401 [Trametes cingulata]|nr:hypothetical protein OH77DRAFT_962401 [Trametes cingulata]
MASQVGLKPTATSFGEACVEHDGPGVATNSYTPDPTGELHTRRADLSSDLLLGPLAFYLFSFPHSAPLTIPEIDAPVGDNESRFSATTSQPSKEARVPLQLPTEMWLEVFGFAARASQRTLADTTAVSSFLHGAAEEALYKFPELLNIWGARKFASIIADSPHRARIVRGLHLCCPSKHTDDFIAAVHEVLPKLERLHSLDLFGIGDECVDEETAFRLFQGLELRSLRRIRGRPLCLSPRVIAALRMFPQLEEIRMYSCTVFPEDNDDDDILVTNRQEQPQFEILRDLPSLCALSCPARIMADIQVAGRLTALCITDATRVVMNDVARLFGMQLISLRVERRLRRYTGLAYPTNWFDWSKLPRLKFLDVRDSGRRCGDLEAQVIRTQTLPPSLQTLVWGPTWVLDCALLDSRSEEWRRETIKEFAETVLRRSSGVKTVVYRWARGKSYLCVLMGHKGQQQYRELVADPAWVDEDAWANTR